MHVYLRCPKESAGGHPFTVSNIPHPLTQTDNERPFESTQELIIRVREGLTKKIFEHAQRHGKDDETRIEGREGHLGQDVPIYACTEGPCGSLSFLLFALESR